MRKIFRKYVVHGLLLCFAWSVLHGAAAVTVADVENNSAAALLARYAVLGEQLRSNPFKRPLYLDSIESSNSLRGNIYAEIAYPFALVGKSLTDSSQWCDVLMLHLNTKYCRAQSAQGATAMTVMLGKKYDQPLKDANKVNFAYSVVTNTPDYFDVRMNAKEGPLSTKDYRILLEAVALPNGHTFMHLSYSYGFGFSGAMAMRVYLATIGSGKVGFTKMKGGASTDAYIGGMRGVVERNTMRYYLAIDAFLSGLAAAPADRLETRLQNWFTATDQYARQLHEIEREPYLKMKRNEYRRLQTEL